MAGRAVAFALLLAILLHPARAADVEGQKCPTKHFRYIGCQVCELIVEEISEQVANKREEKLQGYKDALKEKVPAWIVYLAEKFPGASSLFIKKIHGVLGPEIPEIIHQVCSPEKQEGQWISRIDIFHKGEKLKLVKQQEEGYCDEKCKIIQCACNEVMNQESNNNYKAVAGFVQKRMPLLSLRKELVSDQLSTDLKKKLCQQLSNACAKDPPPVPKGIPGASSMQNNFGASNDEDNFLHRGGKGSKRY